MLQKIMDFMKSLDGELRIKAEQGIALCERAYEYAHLRSEKKIRRSSQTLRITMDLSWLSKEQLMEVKQRQQASANPILGLFSPAKFDCIGALTLTST